MAPGPCERERAHFCISVEADDLDDIRRVLRMDTLRRAYVDLDDPTHLEFASTRLLGDVVDALTLAGEPMAGLHVGGGGFTLPRYTEATRPGSPYRVLELNPVVVDLAREEPGLVTSDDLSVVIGDARLSLRDEPDAAYDIHIGDTHTGPAVPWHLTAKESVADVQRVPRPGGIYAVNIIDYPPLRRARSQLATFTEVFEHLAVYGSASRMEGTSGGNVILLASEAPLPAEALLAANRTHGGWAS